MTASPSSLATIIADRLSREGALFGPTPAPGVIDFELDGLLFRIVVIDEAETIEGVAIWRSTDVTDEEAESLIDNMTATERAQVARAQELAAEAEKYPTPEEEPLGNFGDAQAAEFESHDIGGEG